MTKSIYHMTSGEVAAALAGNQTVVVPFGSVEQHGPHLPCGTDTIAAKLVAEEVAARLDAVVVPFGPYGVTPIHAGHPGTVSLRRTTFESLLGDICDEMVAMGATRFVFVNWHEGNIASMDAVATELQARHKGVYIAVAHACYTAQRVYAAEGGELTHGGGIETLAVIAHDPSLAAVEAAGEATRSEHAAAMDEMRRDREVHGYITDVTEIDDDGWYGNPRWATAEAAVGFAGRMADEIVPAVERIFALRGGG
jgi:creatinine amidohydrolase